MSPINFPHPPEAMKYTPKVPMTVVSGMTAWGERRATAVWAV